MMFMNHRGTEATEKADEEMINHKGHKEHKGKNAIRILCVLRAFVVQSFSLCGLPVSVVQSD